MELNQEQAMVAKILFPEQPAETLQQLEYDMQDYFARQDKTLREKSNQLHQGVMEQNPEANFEQVSHCISTLYGRLLESVRQTVSKPGIDAE